MLAKAPTYHRHQTEDTRTLEPSIKLRLHLILRNKKRVFTTNPTPIQPFPTMVMARGEHPQRSRRVVYSGGSPVCVQGRCTHGRERFHEVCTHTRVQNARPHGVPAHTSGETRERREAGAPRAIGHLTNMAVPLFLTNTAKHGVNRRCLHALSEGTGVSQIDGNLLFRSYFSLGELSSPLVNSVWAVGELLIEFINCL